KLSLIETLTNEGKIPLRVVHNDTKINNLLFRDKKAVAVIDLDTVGPGILYYDYGDALRTSACTAKEDEKNLDLVRFNIEAFKAFSNGYLPQVKSILSNEEREWFYLAPVLLTYIMGIRFLTDYLNGDKYYKISYPGHNLDRSRVQMTLIRSMEEFETNMKSIIDILL
ncbi:MAG: phosphotransferase, partial [Bacteroidales bacterium]|nr:phosphotransferase [Bacteroidales bacterium]